MQHDDHMRKYLRYLVYDNPRLWEALIWYHIEAHCEHMVWEYYDG